MGTGVRTHRQRSGAAASMAVMLASVMAGLAGCGESGGATHVRSAAASEVVIPELTAADHAKAGEVLGEAADDAAERTAKLAPALRIPAGAVSFEEGVRHLGSTKLGLARLYSYDPPVDVPARQWCSERWYVGWDHPHYAIDTYAVSRMRALSAHLDTGGTLVCVQPADFETVGTPTMGPDLPGETPVPDKD